jgi:hypothetical protein
VTHALEEQINEYYPQMWSRDSAVGIATDYELDGEGVGFRVPNCPDRLWSPPNLLSKGYRELLPGVKRPGREADHSPPASAEVK